MTPATLPVIDRPPLPPPTRSVLLFARTFRRRMLKPGVLWPYFALVALVLLGAIGVAVKGGASAREIASFVKEVALRGCTFIALGLGTATMRLDRDSGSLDYYRLRPHSAIALPLGRSLVAIGIAATLTVIATLGAAVISDIGLLGRPVAAWRLLLTCVLSATVYTSIFCWLAAAVERPVVVGFAYLIVGDASLSAMDAHARWLSPTAHLANFSGMLAEPAPASPPPAVSALALLALSALALFLCVRSFAGSEPRRRDP